MNNKNSSILAALLISAAAGLATWIGLYFFFNIHRELEVQAAYSWRFGLLAFFLSLIITVVYFRVRTKR